MDGGIGRPQLWTIGQRRLWIFALFALLLLLYASRTALPVCIVKIANESHWNKRTTGIVLSSFFWGYTANQVTSGWLADQHGGELVLWVSCIGWSMATLAMSIAGRLSPWVLFLTNLINGATQAATFPSLLSLLSVRVSEERRSFSYSLIFFGASIGVIATGILGQVFLSRDRGWEYIFLLIGFTSVMVGLILRGLSKRVAHKTHYRLQDSSSKLAIDNGRAINVNLTKPTRSCADVPWKHLMKQKPFLALAYTCFCQGFFFHNMMAWGPTYFYESFPDQRDKAWLFNSLPWVCNGITALLSGWLANNLIKQGCTITITRKLIECFSLFGTAIFLGILALSGAGHASFLIGLFCVVGSYSLQGMHAAGSGINVIDLSPSHCGVLFGVTNSIGALPGIIGVSIIGSILHSTGSWVPVFLIISVVELSGGLIFCCYGSGKKLNHSDNSS